jgi:hypothetical protein
MSILARSHKGGPTEDANHTHRGTALVTSHALAPEQSDLYTLASATEFGVNHGDLDFRPGHDFTHIFGDY